MKDPVSASKAAQMLGVTQPTVVAEIKKGNLPGSYKFGKGYKVPVSAIQDVLNGSQIITDEKEAV